jgi:outer membrane lipoprotein-sorting protein
VIPRDARNSKEAKMSWRLIVIAVALTVFPSVALAEAGDACRFMAKADHNALPFDDQSYLSKITYRENGRVVKTFEIDIKTRGEYKMLITFKAPSDVLGMRILILDPETMYTYLPQFRRVRRVAAHARNQGFLGTNISYEDMSENRYSKRWSCTPAESTNEHYVLDLTPQPGAQTVYSKMRVAIHRKRLAYERIEYYTGTRNIKSQIREGWQDIQGQSMSTKIRFVSHDRNAEATVELTEWQVNQGIPDSDFSQRALLRGD